MCIPLAILAGILQKRWTLRSERDDSVSSVLAGLFWFGDELGIHLSTFKDKISPHAGT